ncbi:hypothetical protein AAC387_Pa08g1507 [Persea americana]
MDVKTVLSMVGGTGDTSYVNNSETQHVVENSIQDLYCTSYPESLNISDLGCSSGPNTLLVIRGIIDAIHERCCQLCRPMPEFRVFLNDFPGNDFNTVFRSLAGFYDTLKEEKGLPFGTCFISGVPRSFYGRLFPRNCLDSVHSSYSVHWLSQLRSEEMTCRGRMVLTLMGRRTEEPSSGESRYVWDLLAQELNKMVSKGVIQKAKLDSFHLPYYSPSAKELKDVIAAEGSFALDQLQITEITVNTNDKKAKGWLVSKCIRAVVESMQRMWKTIHQRRN